MTDHFSFDIQKRIGRARAGVLHTPHGDVETPAFVGVATKATLKGITNEQVREMGLQMMIANTYHLFLSPGEDLIARAGGVHGFMHYQGPLMTDSGGFQVFSLGEGMEKQVSKFTQATDSPRSDLGDGGEGLAFAKGSDSAKPTLYDEEIATQHGKLAIVDDEGVTFTSHIDGSLHRFTPERSVEIQHTLGADIFFAFDECTAPTATYEYQREAMERTHRWAKRSLTAHRTSQVEEMQSASALGSGVTRQAIYGIAQGGQFDDLRLTSARAIGDMGFDGFGLGGSFSKKYGEGSLESALMMLENIPGDMPVHGLGVGEPEDILLGVEYGVDTFDCVTPTRNGRNGTVYTSTGKLHIKRAALTDDLGPLDPACDCYVCTNHSRAYLAHLFRSGEMLGPILASMHNVYFLAKFTADIRQAIYDERFEEFKKDFLEKYVH